MSEPVVPWPVFGSLTKIQFRRNCDKKTDGSKFECKSNNLLLLNLKKLTSGLLKNLEQNKLLLNLENFTSHCLKNPEI